MTELEEKNEEGEGKGYVNYDRFKVHISRVNVAWEDELLDRTTITSQILLSDVFQFEDENGNRPEDAIDLVALLSFALLHCAYRENDSAKVFYTIVQDGGVDSHLQITADDKDFPPFFDKLMRLGSVDIIRWYVDLAGGKR